MVFGPGDAGNFERMQEASTSAGSCVGRRDTVKSCIHVDDVVRFIDMLAHHTESATFHLAFPSPTTIEDIVEAMFDAFGGRYLCPVLPYRLLRGQYPFAALGTSGSRPACLRRIDKLFDQRTWPLICLGQSATRWRTRPSVPPARRGAGRGCRLELAETWRSLLSVGLATITTIAWVSCPPLPFAS